MFINIYIYIYIYIYIDIDIDPYPFERAHPDVSRRRKIVQQRRGPICVVFPRCDMRHGTLGHGAERGAAPEGPRESVVHVLSVWRDNNKAHTWRSKVMLYMLQFNS